ncbi:MAG: succinylglutamate desuccinylase/aspartoacylase family protein [Bdellovibrionales bacterium]|nr:succinylglutamate desuccinylase/aspartoacylase family protein [Bdellovibrionales bacterium]
MMKKILLLLLVLSTNLFAEERIRSYQVSVNPLTMNKIAKDFEVVQKLSKGYEVYVQEQDAEKFLKLAPNAVLLEKNIHVNSTDKAIENYRNWAQVEADLKIIAKNYPNIATLDTYGITAQKRNLYSLKLSTGGENKPKLMLTAATHGDELITTEVLFSLTNELVAGFGKDARITKILEARDIYIIPVVSPDSFEVRERYVQRKDPNRSYPWPENEKNQTVDVIEAMMNYTNKMKFTGSLDLHAYGKLVMYPWAYTKKAPTNSADVVTFKDLVQSMARDNQYTAGQISTTIYVAEGSSCDYYYWKSGTRAIAVEIGREKIPHWSKIPAMVKESREMIWTFLEHFN